jgi:hypothetical protein
VMWRYVARACRTGFDAARRCPKAADTLLSALCENLLNEGGKIVGPCAISQSVSRQENVMISRKCRTNHAKQTRFWRKSHPAFRSVAGSDAIYLNVSRTFFMSVVLSELRWYVTLGSLAAASPAGARLAISDVVTLSVLMLA